MAQYLSIKNDNNNNRSIVGLSCTFMSVIISLFHKLDKIDNKMKK